MGGLNGCLCFCVGHKRHCHSVHPKDDIMHYIVIYHITSVTTHITFAEACSDSLQAAVSGNQMESVAGESQRNRQAEL
jgi:hypothetical protein